MVFVECNSVQQLLLLILILETKALGAATHSLIWYPIYTPPRLGCFIYSIALEVGTTTGLQLQHLHDLLNKYTAFILLLYFDHVLLLCPWFGILSITPLLLSRLLRCYYVSPQWQMPQRAHL
jgi:hypothetical protein